VYLVDDSIILIKQLKKLHKPKSNIHTLATRTSYYISNVKSVLMYDSEC